MVSKKFGIPFLLLASILLLCAIILFYYYFKIKTTIVYIGINLLFFIIIIIDYFLNVIRSSTVRNKSNKAFLSYTKVIQLYNTILKNLLHDINLEFVKSKNNDLQIHGSELMLLFEPIFTEYDKLSELYIKKRNNYFLFFKKFNDLVLFKSNKILEKANIMHTIYNDYINISGLTQKINSRILYHLRQSLVILSDISVNSTRFSHDKMEEIIVEFKKVIQYTSKISSESQATMKDLMNESNKKSLAVILNNSQDIITKTQDLDEKIIHIRQYSDTFIKSNDKEFKNLMTLSEDISNISETMRMIAFNINILAARSGSTNSSSSFQILGKELSNFALQTKETAINENKILDYTLNEINQTKNVYQSNFDDITHFSKYLYSQISSFISTIDEVFTKFSEIINNLSSLSINIEKSVKTMIGKIQYFDVIRQEVEHFHEYFDKSLSAYYNMIIDIGIEEHLDDADKNNINTEILITLNNIISTDTERKILEHYLAKYGIVIRDEEKLNDALKDSTVKEGTIFF